MKKVFIYGERDLLQNYAEALEFCGAVPVFSQDISDSQDCAGLLLPGGGDVDPARYGQELDGSANIDQVRDERELEAIEKFASTSRPILGICRGLQILTVAFGGSLIQDIETAPAHKWEESTGDKVHPIQVSKNSFLYPIYGQQFSVNSAHHQAICSLAPGFHEAARADDGVMEAMQCPEKRVYAVQWHPERMAFHHSRSDTVDGRPVFEFFLKLLD